MRRHLPQRLWFWPWLVTVGICTGLIGFTTAAAQATPPFVIHTLTVTGGDTDMLLHMGSRLRLPKEPRNALYSGLSLHFQVEVQLFQEYQWWLDRTVAAHTLRYRLVYRSLTGRFIVQSLDYDTEVSYPALSSALAYIGNLKDFPVTPLANLESDARYRGTATVFLDISQLPAPLRPTAFISNDWRISSEPQTWYWPQ